MPASAKALAPATRKAREEVKSAIWLTIGVSTLSESVFVPTGRTIKMGSHDHANNPRSGARPAPLVWPTLDARFRISLVIRHDDTAEHRPHICFEAAY